MTDEGILEGDTIILRHDTSAETDQVAVASASCSVPRKPIGRSGHIVGVEPGNAKFPTHTYAHNQMKGQGQLIALLRRYWAQ
jgi:SOS-response transcriptional repressor LexA